MSTTAAVPMKSSGQRLSDPIVVGKDILELVSASMYIDPLTIFREYIQNSVDSIDEAAARGAYYGAANPRIDIGLRAAERRITIRDNGLGVRRGMIARTLTAFGASKKRGTNARGFRGVGRLSGLAYCKRLVFRTRHIDDEKVSEIRWDCERLKTLLRDPAYTGCLDDIVREIVSVHWSDESNYPKHFFEVELQEPVRIKNDLLLNEESVHQYLSQVGPVPFSPEFKIGREITSYLRGFDVGKSYEVFINDATAPVYRPFRDSFDARLGVIDHFAKLERLEISGATDGIAAVGWILHHGYKGALPSGIGVKGIRLRKGNMQVGGDSLLDEVFDEARFNAWCVAELHIIGKNIVPNGRRDSFDLNRDYQDLLSKLRPTAKNLSKLCRVKSQERHAKLDRGSATITSKQERLLSRVSNSKQKAFREVVEALYHLKGVEAEGLVTTLLTHLVKGK